jgi:hypothetical protein
MFDTLDDVFWMLPFSSKMQAQIIRQENQITVEEWENPRYLIMAEHRLPNSKEQLKQHWKAWIAQDAFSARRAAASCAGNPGSGRSCGDSGIRRVAVYYFTTCFSSFSTLQ